MQSRRPMLSQDLPQIRRLLDAVAAQTGRRPLSEYKAIRVGTESAGWHDVVVLDRGRIVGYAAVAYHRASDPGERGHWAVEVVVEPDAGEGVAESVVEAALGEVPPGGRVGIWASDPRIARLLDQLGFEARRTLLELEVALPVDAEARIPPGIRLERFRRGVDEEAWLIVNNAAFAGHPENGALTMADLDERFAQPWFDPRGLLLARAGEELAGFCWTKVHPDGIGEIYIIAVHPAWQGRGLGRSLVIAGLEVLHQECGAGSAILYTESDNEAALGLYRRLGFHERYRLTQFAPAEAMW